MGLDKAALPAGDGTLIEHLARRLAPVVDEIIVAGGSAELRLEGVRPAADRDAGLGPLSGIHAGLTAARHPHAFVVACDLPDVEPALVTLLQELAGPYEAVVPRVDREPEGVCALYARTIASRVEALLDAGERSVKTLLAATHVRYVGREELFAVDPELRSFRNLNTPADYQAWIREQPASR